MQSNATMQHWADCFGCGQPTPACMRAWALKLGCHTYSCVKVGCSLQQYGLNHTVWLIPFRTNRGGKSAALWCNWLFLLLQEATQWRCCAAIWYNKSITTCSRYVVLWHRAVVDATVGAAVICDLLCFYQCLWTLLRLHDIAKDVIGGFEIKKSRHGKHIKFLFRIRV